MARRLTGGTFAGGTWARGLFPHQLHAASFDIAALVSVLGEVSDREACLRSLYRVLRPGGVIAFHEAIPDPDLIQCNRLRCMAEAQGFRFRQRWGPSWNFTVTFERPAASAQAVV